MNSALLPVMEIAVMTLSWTEKNRADNSDFSGLSIEALYQIFPEPYSSELRQDSSLLFLYFPLENLLVFIRKEGIKIFLSPPLLHRLFRYSFSRKTSFQLNGMKMSKRTLIFRSKINIYIG